MTGDFSLLQPIPQLPAGARQAWQIFALHWPASPPLQVAPFPRTPPSGRSFSGDMAQAAALPAPETGRPVDHQQLGIVRNSEFKLTAA